VNQQPASPEHAVVVSHKFIKDTLERKIDGYLMAAESKAGFGVF
jgi:hypothetical protein